MNLYDPNEKPFLTKRQAETAKDFLSKAKVSVVNAMWLVKGDPHLKNHPYDDPVEERLAMLVEQLQQEIELLRRYKRYR